MDDPTSAAASQQQEDEPQSQDQQQQQQQQEQPEQEQQQQQPQQQQPQQQHPRHHHHRPWAVFQHHGRQRGAEGTVPGVVWSERLQEKLKDVDSSLAITTVISSFAS